MAKKLEDMLLELLADPAVAADQADLAQAAALARQERALRQRAGAAAARLRQARTDGAAPDEIAELEATLEARGTRLQAAGIQAEAANVKRPDPDDTRAQVFVRAMGTIEAPPVTLAALDASGKPVALATANAAGIAHLVADGGLQKVTLQLSDKKARVLWRATDPVNIAAGDVLYLDAPLDPPKPEPGPVPKTPTMPNLVGQSEGVARKLLERLGVDAIEIETKEESGQPGIVIGQAPDEGQKLAEDTTVTLTVRKSTDDTEMLYVPGLVGASASQAQDRLKALGLNAELKPEVHDGPADIVLKQDPNEGQPIDPGATVTLIVSQARDDAPDTTVVPDLAGQSRDTAEALLKAAGLRADVTETAEAGTPVGVTDQVPEAGTTVPRDTTVKIIVNTPPVVTPGTAILPNLKGRTLADAQRILKDLGLKTKVNHQADAAPKDEVLSQVPVAGTRVAAESTITLRVSSGPEGPSDQPGDITRLARAMARDPRAEQIGADESRLVAMLRQGGVDDLGQAHVLSELEPEALRDRLQLGTLKTAKTFRAMLRKALKEIG